MLTFTVNQGKVVIDPNIILMKPFSDIVDYGNKVKNADLANRMLLYVYYCCDLSLANPMKELSYTDKPKIAFADSFSGIDKKEFTKVENLLIEAAIEKYNLHNTDAPERLMDQIDQKIDQIRVTLSNTTPEIVRNTKPTGEISFSSNEAIIKNLIKLIESCMNSKVTIQDAMLKIKKQGRVTGKTGQFSLLEMGRLADVQK